MFDIEIWFGELKIFTQYYVYFMSYDINTNKYNARVIL